MFDSLSKSGQARTTFWKRYTRLPQEGERNKDRETEIDQPPRCKLNQIIPISHDFPPVKRNG